MERSFPGYNTKILVRGHAGTNALIWRGTATDITVSPSPAKMQKRLEKALRKLVDQWRTMKGKGS